MEEKTKKIWGFIAGFFILGIFGAILGFSSLGIMMTIGRGGEISLLIAFIASILLITLLKRVINFKYFFMGIAINVLGLLAFIFIFLGACAANPFMGSSNPGAGTPFYIVATIIAIFFIILLIAVIKNIGKNSENYREIQQEQNIQEKTNLQESNRGISKLGMFWIGFASAFASVLVLNPLLRIVFGSLASLIWRALPGYAIFGSVFIYPFLSITAIAIVALVLFIALKNKVGFRYGLLGFFTAIFMGLLWIGSCFGGIMAGGAIEHLFGTSSEGLLSLPLGMIAAVIVPIAALIIIVKKIAKASKEQPAKKYREVWASS